MQPLVISNSHLWSAARKVVTLTRQGPCPGSQGPSRAPRAPTASSTWPTFVGTKSSSSARPIAFTRPGTAASGSFTGQNTRRCSKLVIHGNAGCEAASCPLRHASTSTSSPAVSRTRNWYSPSCGGWAGLASACTRL
eukprot:scaffold129484_cov63-Phaeocystis_antarctica.AAC.7